MLMPFTRVACSAHADHNWGAEPDLRSQVRDAERMEALAAGGIADPAAGQGISVDKERFEERAQEYEINDVEAFYSSSLFTEHRFSLDAAASRIAMAR
jgi:hypothetical protein